MLYPESLGICREFDSLLRAWGYAESLDVHKSVHRCNWSLGLCACGAEGQPHSRHVSHAAGSCAPAGPAQGHLGRFMQRASQAAMSQSRRQHVSHAAGSCAGMVLSLSGRKHHTVVVTSYLHEQCKISKTGVHGNIVVGWWGTASSTGCTDRHAHRRAGRRRSQQAAAIQNVTLNPSVLSRSGWLSHSFRCPVRAGARLMQHTANSSAACVSLLPYVLTAMTVH